MVVIVLVVLVAVTMLVVTEQWDGSICDVTFRGCGIFVAAVVVTVLKLMLVMIVGIFADMFIDRTPIDSNNGDDDDDDDYGDDDKVRR